MQKLKYKIFTWPENPEVFEIHATMDPMYQIAQDGTIRYQGMGPLCRTIRARGVFHGPRAYVDFNALAVIMATGTAGELIHPTWGTISAFMTDLRMEQESRENYVVYSVAFREANENGEIPHMPQDLEQMQKP